MWSVQAVAAGTLVTRHQTLRAAKDWSFDLLSQKERALLRRLSVFASGPGARAPPPAKGKAYIQIAICLLISS